ncbi:TonB-dependent siderophore receptor [Phenylobacterium sp. Root700]|uniref:TonB-dependent receptor plug domain-containing protein n=1 Tax=Phenylobacterium sp. Root700 TaxID=1736591 RepID=UPI0006F6694E|nr:TonB-dependent receptor [Phenylobacterium sp. Root700]KRB41972.1 TonB-dependent receptor [Phenylobacterium sp. Root700]
MKTVLYATTAVLCGLSTHALAQGASPVAVASVSELVVTANRSPQEADRVGQSITVVSGEAIKAAQSVDVSTLLAQTPGVSFSRNGGVGGSTSLRIRGAESDQTVVVIDGVKLNDPSTSGGGYNFSNLLSGDIGRIEILRGAQSTLWGSQAIGGVVNIITQEAETPFEANLTAEGGSMGTGYLRAAAGGKTDRVTWRLAGGRYETDGVSSYRLGKEKDGYENTGFSGRAVVRATDAISLDLRGVYSKGKNNFDGFPPPNFSFGDTPEYGETEEFVGYAAVNFDLFDGTLQNRVAYGYTRTNRQNFNPNQAMTDVTFDARGENKRWEYQGVWTISDAWTATFGGESENSDMRTASPNSLTPNPKPTTAKTGIDGLYAQVQGEVLTGLTLTAGLRRDSHDTFGDKTLGQLAAAWSLNDGNTVLRASFGQGFKAPTLYQLYSEYGNAALAPEEADGWDAGIEQHVLDRFMVRATYFDRDTTNQIDFVSCTSTTTNPLCFVRGVRRSGAYANTASTKAHGLELEGSADLGPLRVLANYTWTDTTNDSVGNANRGKHLTRRPEHQANIQATYTWTNDASLGAAIRYVGASFDNAANSYVLQSYTLVDLRASYPVNETFEVYGRVENAFDDSYETTRNYGSPGRGAHVGVRAKF